MVTFIYPIFITRLIYDEPNLKENDEFKIKISSLIAGVRLFSENETPISDKNDDISDSNSKKKL
jgi:hypothetical protein